MSDFLGLFLEQLQSPTLGFLIGGIVVAALGSQLAIPDSIYKFISFFLLMKIGLTGGIAIRNSNPSEIFLPAIAAVLLGVAIVFISRFTLGKLPGIKVPDAVATGGLFGAVSGSTLAAVLPQLDAAKVPYEAWTAALYPFMDIPALVTAIVVASVFHALPSGRLSCFATRTTAAPCSSRASMSLSMVIVSSPVCENATRFAAGRLAGWPHRVRLCCGLKLATQGEELGRGHPALERVEGGSEDGIGTVAEVVHEPATHVGELGGGQRLKAGGEGGHRFCSLCLVVALPAGPVAGGRDRLKKAPGRP